MSSEAKTRKLQMAPLADRNVIAVSGSDATSFLNGIVTNNVLTLLAQDSHKDRPQHVYAAFLNAIGRVLQDVFIHIHPDSSAEDPTYLVEHDASETSALQSQMKRFKLRAKVRIQDVSTEWQICTLFGHTQSLLGLEGYRDLRAPGMGWRFITPHGRRSGIQADFTVVDRSAYTLHRILNGVPEGPLDIARGSAIPLENNLDLMGGIDFRKGCYVGQELTARTHHKGEVRKRLMPVRLVWNETIPDAMLPMGWSHPFPIDFDASHLPQPHTDLKAASFIESRARASGKMGTSLLIHDANYMEAPPVAVGLAHLRLEQLETPDGKPNVFTTSAASNERGRNGLSASGSLGKPDEPMQWLIRAFVPTWWQQRLPGRRVDSLSPLALDRDNSAPADSLDR